jgi:hypothetical protein
MTDTDRTQTACRGKANSCDNKARYATGESNFPSLCGLCDIAENKGQGTRVPWGGLRQ